MLLKAPFIITMSGDVIENGAVRTDGDRIAEVGVGVKATKADATIKLDDCILLPGLVNAHCHLDLSYLAGHIAPTQSFAGWVEHVVAEKRRATDLAITNGLRTALQQCYRSGITCLGDHITHPSVLPFLLQMPIRGRAFLEVTGPSEAQAKKSLAAATEAIKQHERNAKRMKLSITPHAPYSLHADLLRTLMNASADVPVSIHCAETQEEWDCFARCNGPLFDFITHLGFATPAPSRSPIDYLERNGGIHRNTVLIHANYIDDTDIAGIHSAGATIVHCPQSHRYFGSTPFPLEKVRAAGIPVALGTDGLTTAPTLNLLTEMQLVKERHPTLAAKEILAMSTVNGARALGMQDVCGAIAPGLRADLIAVHCGDNPHNDPYDTVLRHSEVPFVVIDGRIVRNVLKGEHHCSA